MQDHNLDDLIIDNINPKNSKTKSFLTIIGLAIVVLIIAIILTKIILKDPNSDVILDDNNVELLSPDLTLQSVTEEVIKKPLVPTTEEPKQKVIPDSTVKETLASPKIETVEITNEFATEEETKRKAKIEALQKEKEIQKNLAEEKLAQQKATYEKAQQEKAQAKKVLAEKQAALKKERTRKAEAMAKQAVDAGNPYFIQVGSFSKTPSERFLAVITNSGFNYQVTAPSDNGTKKLLIGPYGTKTDAENALIKVKDRINKSAYIFRK